MFGLFSSVVCSTISACALALSCASCSTSWPVRLSKPLSPGPIEISIALWLEDECQDQDKDDKTVTVLEALHDGVLFPLEALTAVGIVSVVSTAWSIIDRFTLPPGSQLPNRAEVVMAAVAPRRVGPALHHPSTIHSLPVTWFGCLAYDDG